MTDPSDLFERIQRLREQTARRDKPTALERMIQNIHRQRRVVEVLDTFIQNIYVADGLHREESQRNIAESLIEIKYYCQHSSNGLLITDDGYFLTALHCVQDDGRHPLYQARVHLYDGTSYPIERICASLKAEDIAIVKAAIPKECKPRSYKFYNTNVLQNDGVTLLTRWDGNLVVKDGSITYADHQINIEVNNQPSTTYHNHFLTNLTAIPGDSGGVILTVDGRVAGLVSTGGGYSAASGVKIIEALKLVEAYKRHVFRRI